MFNAFRYTELSDVKVVILGRDPYHGPAGRMGWHFPYVRAWRSPSLLNMYKELEGTVPGFTRPNHGYRKLGAPGRAVIEHGTHRAGRPAHSHASPGWETFTDKVISLINEHREGVVFYSGDRMRRRKGRLLTASVITC